jgi:hypothetical protein
VHNNADDYQVRDDVSWVKGSHQFKFGASWALYKKVQDLFGPTQGSFGFNGQYTGNDFADFLLGLSNSYNELAVQDKGYWNNISPAAYFQDNWKVGPRLTLNLGLRWDGIPHTYEANNRMSNFYPGLYNPANAALLSSDSNSILPTSPGLGPSPNSILNGYQFYLNGIGVSGKNGIPKGLVKDSWLDFGPRVGFAYDLTGAGKTVLRGGFGIMYERIQGNDMYNAGPNQPFSASVTFNNVSLSYNPVRLSRLRFPSAASPALRIQTIGAHPATNTAWEYNTSFRPVRYCLSHTSAIRTGIRTTIAKPISRTPAFCPVSSLETQAARTTRLFRFSASTPSTLQRMRKTVITTACRLNCAPVFTIHSRCRQPTRFPARLIPHQVPVTSAEISPVFRTHMTAPMTTARAAATALTSHSPASFTSFRSSGVRKTC